MVCLHLAPCLPLTTVKAGESLPAYSPPASFRPRYFRRPNPMTSPRSIELVCPAGSLPALKSAIDHGADCVYLGFKDATNARNFSGLNFDDKALAEGVRYAHARGRKVLLALNTYPQADNWPRWTAAVDRAADFGIDAVILADPGLMAYARKTHPQLRLHLSVQGSATSYDAINFYFEHFGIARAVLPALNMDAFKASWAASNGLATSARKASSAARAQGPPELAAQARNRARPNRNGL